MFCLACSAGGFGGFHLSSVQPPFWIHCRLGELERECENVGGGWGWGRKDFLPPPPSPIFLSPSHRLGKLFTSPQLSTVFLIQDGGLLNRWEYPLAPPKSTRTAGYVLSRPNSQRFKTLFNIHSMITLLYNRLSLYLSITCQLS